MIATPHTIDVYGVSAEHVLEHSSWCLVGVEGCAMFGAVVSSDSMPRAEHADTLSLLRDRLPELLDVGMLAELRGGADCSVPATSRVIITTTSKNY